MNTPRKWLALATLFVIGTSAITLSAQEQSAPVLIRLERTLDAAYQAQLDASGIELLHHYGELTYLATGTPQGAARLPEEESTQRHRSDDEARATPR